jgi:hypothetical protein
MVMRAPILFAPSAPPHRWLEAGRRAAYASPAALRVALHGPRVVLPWQIDTAPLLAALRDENEKSHAAADHDWRSNVERLLAVTRRHFDAPVPAAEHRALASPDAPPQAPAPGRVKRPARRRIIHQGTTE